MAKVEHFQSTSYTDFDWEGSVNSLKPTTGYVFSLGTSAVSWVSKKHASLSSTKAQYRAAVKGESKAVWQS
jgi:hypothetical protein